MPWATNAATAASPVVMRGAATELGVLAMGCFSLGIPWGCCFVAIGGLPSVQIGGALSGGPPGVFFLLFLYNPARPSGPPPRGKAPFIPPYCPPNLRPLLP